MANLCYCDCTVGLSRGRLVFRAFWSCVPGGVFLLAARIILAACLLPASRGCGTKRPRWLGLRARHTLWPVLASSLAVYCPWIFQSLALQLLCAAPFAQCGCCCFFANIIGHFHACFSGIPLPRLYFFFLAGVCCVVLCPLWLGPRPCLLLSSAAVCARALLLSNSTLRVAMA